MTRYTDSTEGIEPEQLTGFFVGWLSQPSPERHLAMLEGSSHVVLAIDDASDSVVGFITAVSDGVLAAYIPFLEVLPEYHSQGIGAELVRRMVDQLRDLYMIDLLCDPEIQPYYERFGMRRATGMMLRNYDQQSGDE